MNTSELPPLFSVIPPDLFRPLTGMYASLYWSVLARFYQLEFEREPFFIVKSVAIQTAEEALQGSPFWKNRREELLASVAVEESPASEPPSDLDESALLRETAKRLVARLERAGWIQFEYRREKGEVLNFPPYAARLLEAFARIARDEQPIFQGVAHTIASLLKPDTFSSRPGASLTEAKRHAFDLVRELKILNQNIHVFIQRVLDEISTASGVLQEGLDRYQEIVMGNYHRLKTVDNLYKWRGDILLRLDTIGRDTLSLEAAARWYAEQHRLDILTAARRVAEDVALLRSQFETLPQITDDLDARNSRFSGVALRKLMYLLRHDKRVEGQLQFIVDHLARDQAPDLLFDVYRCELLADGFLYTAPRRRPKPEPQRLVRAKGVDEEVLRASLAHRVRRPYARARVEGYVEALFGGRDRVPLSDASVDSDEEYIRLIYIAAYGLDGGSRYRFQPPPNDSDSERRGIYGFPRGFLARRKRKEPS